MAATHLSGPLVVAGVEVVNSSGAITADIQATAGSIGATELASNAVEEAKINNGAVTTNKIASGAVTSDKIDRGVIQTMKKTLTATTLVGTDSGDIGHSDGSVILANQGVGTVTEVISAVLVYNYDTAAYTGGGDDMVIRSATTALTPVIAKADLVGASSDKIVFVMPTGGTADIALTENNVINLRGTAFTQPGTAAGTLDVYLTYRVLTI